MPEAVIVSTARSPIGRAFKGSLKDVRPDDLAATVVARRPGQGPGARPGHGRRPLPRLRRAVGRARAPTWPAWSPCWPGYDHLPGATVNRFCASSVQTTRMAFHAIKAGEGDVFVSRRRRVRLPLRRLRRRRRVQGRLAEPAVRRGAGAHRSADGRGRTTTWPDPREDGQLPDVYIAMGQTAENVADLRGVTRERQDEWGVDSQNRAEKAIADGFFDREITPVTTPDGTVVSTDDGPRPGVTLEGVARLKPVFREQGTVTAGNCCPLNDGAAALVVMSDTKAAELGLTPARPGRRRPASARCPPRSWASARSRRPARRSPAPA